MKVFFILLIPPAFGPVADSVLIQTLAEMTPGMVLDLVVQEVLEDGSVVFSGGPVPDLVLRASRYHRAGEWFCFAHHGLLGRPCAHCSLWIQRDMHFPIHRVDQLIVLKLLVCLACVNANKDK